MASFRTNQLRASSKAQASLNKILHTITSVKPPSFPRFDIDLNFSLVGASSESDGNGEYRNGNLDACSFVVGKQIESDSSGNINNNDCGKKTKEGSGSCSDVTITTTTTNLRDAVENENDAEPLREQNDDGGNEDHCLSMLIAAAELISSTEAESLPAAPPSQVKEVDAGDKSSPLLPVVRSKRGRSQVLPYRYRDSVILRESKRRR